MVIFAAIAIASFLLVAGSFIFQHDFDHDVGLDTDTDASGDHSSDHSSSLLSIKVVGTLFMGFGAAGTIASAQGAGPFASSVIGIICGLILAALVNLMLGVIIRQQSSSLVATESLVGSTGTVTVSIAPEGLGEVGVSSKGQYGTYVAKSALSREIAKGRTVSIVRAIGSQLIVEDTQT